MKFGTDAIKIAVDQAHTDAPAGLTASDLANIYDGTWTTWGQVTADGGSPSGATIIPEIPPSSSSIYSKFVAALVAANSNFSVDASVVKTVEQNDPTAITGASSPADAIVPFSQARLNLGNDGYFYSPNTVFPGAASPSTPGVVLLSGTSPNTGASLNISLSDYFVLAGRTTRRWPRLRTWWHIELGCTPSSTTRAERRTSSRLRGRRSLQRQVLFLVATQSLLFASQTRLATPGGQRRTAGLGGQHTMLPPSPVRPIR